MGLGKGLALSAIVVARVTEFRPCRSSRASHERVPPVSRTGFKTVSGAGPVRGQPHFVLGRQALVTWDGLRAKRGAPSAATRYRF